MTTPAEQGIRAARDEDCKRCLQCGDVFTPMSANEIFCGKECYEAYEDRDWDYSDGGNFRASRKTETFIRENGKPITMRLCEELINGRWEPFYTVKEVEERRA